MLSETMLNALNEQINHELWSAYMYESMACHFDDAGRKGFANWFYIQAKEELDHVKIFEKYILARGGRVELKAIDAVPTEWDSPLAAMKATLAHEQKVTAYINSLYRQALDENDYATREMLNWFVAEQVEEEENDRDIIDDLELVGNDGTGIYQIDQKLLERQYKKPSILNKD